MPENRYPRVARILQEHPWAILPSALELIVEIVERRVAGVDVAAEDTAAAIEAARRVPAPAAAPGAIAVLPLFGVMANRMHMFRNVSQSGTSTEAYTLAFRAAMENPGIGAIVLDIDSPGGSVHGIAELAEEIHAARGRKPIVAVANAMAASAAYWVASQADELVVAPSGEVGSIGVYALHEDASRAAEQEGYKFTYISAGKYKTEGNPFEPLGDEARAYMQSRVDDHHRAFVKGVARGRKVSQEKVRESFGEGRMVLAEEAVRRGMADRTGTLQETIDRLVERQEKASGARAAGDLDRARARLRLAGV